MPLIDREEEQDIVRDGVDPLEKRLYTTPQIVMKGSLTKLTHERVFNFS